MMHSGEAATTCDICGEQYAGHAMHVMGDASPYQLAEDFCVAESYCAQSSLRRTRLQASPAYIVLLQRVFLSKHR